MIVAIDVHYRENRAKVVAALFHNWEASVAENHVITYVEDVEEYVPGAFYKRELPCILAVLAEVDLDQVNVIVLDGFVFLDDEGKPGLGGHLYEHLRHQVPIIGVAKTRFHQNTRHVAEVNRGDSTKPLFITAIGIDLANAADHIRNMTGSFRMPDILQVLDRKTKEA